MVNFRATKVSWFADMAAKQPLCSDLEMANWASWSSFVVESTLLSRAELNAPTSHGRQVDGLATLRHSSGALEPPSEWREASHNNTARVAGQPSTVVGSWRNATQ